MDRFDLNLILHTPKFEYLNIVRHQNELLLKSIKGENFMTNANSKSNVALKTISLVALLVLISVCILAGCGGTQVEGMWKLDRVTDGETTIYSTTEDKGEYGDDFNNELTFNEDGSCSIKIRSETATNGEWTRTNNTITVTIEGEDTPQTYTLRGEELTVENGNIKYFYKKSS